MATDQSSSSPTATVRELPAAHDDLPGLSLPACSLHPSHEQAVHDPDTNHPKTITRVEQVLRVLLANEGEQAIPDRVEAYTKYKWEQEAEYYRPDADWAAWQGKLGEYATDQIQALREEEARIQQNRRKWLLDDIPQELARHAEKAQTIHREIHTEPKLGWQQALVLPADTTPRDYDQPIPDEVVLVTESNLNNAVLPSDIGLELPAPLVVGTFPSSSGGTSTYSLLPYCGTVVCGGPYFHKNPASAMCKHLVYALLKAARNPTSSPGLLPLDDHVVVPDRVRQLIAPEALSRYQPERY